MGLSPPAGMKLLKQEADTGKKQQILLQPRLCTLRSYGEDRFSVLRKTVVDVGGGERREMVESTFMEKLFEYIESSNKSHEVEILSGRLAMVSINYQSSLFVLEFADILIWCCSLIANH